MSNWYKLIFRQIEPIHIGSNKHGIINETKIFIPGITMWGALTNAYGKLNKWKKDDYKLEKNKKLFENITCFYPMINGNIMLPKFEDGELFLGYCSEKEFRKDFTTTYLSTAINPSSLNAQDESLHEIDVILPKDIYWVGYLKIEDKNKIPKEIIVGGDSRYGFGKMILEKKEKENYSYSVKKGIYQDNNYPQNKPLSNYLKFDNNQKFEGTIELLAEFDFDSKIPVVKNSKNYGYYITSGSIIKGNI